jgi:hypothetical protein
MMQHVEDLRGVVGPTIRMDDAGKKAAREAMVAGFLLGPSYLGWVAPDVQTRLFPEATRPVLFVTSQLGLILYMFCVGLEFRVDLVARLRRRALAVSAAGITVPFGLGAALALLMLGRGGFSPSTSRQCRRRCFSARQCRSGLSRARPHHLRAWHRGHHGGDLALTAGAVDDAAAWVILAFALSSFNANATFALGAALGALVYAAFVFLGLRPFLRRLAAAVERRDTLTLPVLSTMLACNLARALSAAMEMLRIQSGWPFSSAICLPVDDSPDGPSDLPSGRGPVPARCARP